MHESVSIIVYTLAVGEDVKCGIPPTLPAVIPTPPLTKQPPYNTHTHTHTHARTHARTYQSHQNKTQTTTESNDTPLYM